MFPCCAQDTAPACVSNYTGSVPTNPPAPERPKRAVCRKGLHPFSTANTIIEHRQGKLVRRCLQCTIARRDAPTSRVRWHRRERTHCDNGVHPWTPENQYVDPRTGNTTCLPCRTAGQRRRLKSYVWVSCAVARCGGGVYRKSDAAPYLCPRHRKYPPPAIVKLGIHRQVMQRLAERQRTRQLTRAS